MNIKVKICGIRSIESAKTAQEAGADYLGFNFVESSKRRVTLEQTKEIINDNAVNIGKVGIFQNQGADYINEIAESLKLDFVQLHGNENMDFIKQIKTKIIKAIRLDGKAIEEIIGEMKQYQVDYFLLDRDKQGEGNIIDLTIAREIAEKFQVFFAGGLNPNNVKEIIQTVKPYGIDVAGGVETNGQEDVEKIKLFISKVKNI